MCIWGVVPGLSSSCSFPLSSSRLQSPCPPSPAACSNVPEFLRVLNFRETTSLEVRLAPGLHLYTRPLPPPSRATTSEAEGHRHEEGHGDLQTNQRPSQLSWDTTFTKKGRTHRWRIQITPPAWNLPPCIRTEVQCGVVVAAEGEEPWLFFCLSPFNNKCHF